MINICLLKNAFCGLFSKYLSKQLNSCIGYSVSVFVWKCSCCVSDFLHESVLSFDFNLDLFV